MAEAAEQPPMIYAKMAEVMTAVQVVKKEDRNEHQRFMFRGIDAVMNAVGPVLREKGVIVVPTILDVAYDKVHTTQNKPATACRVQVDYTFWAEDGSNLSVSVAGEAWDSGDKATPKAMSVAFRTALLQALCLPTDEPDPDSQTYEQARPGPMTKDQFAKMGTAFGALGMSGPENADSRAALFADVLGRETKGGDITEMEADVILKALAERGPTPEQEALLSESLGTTPVEEKVQKVKDEGMGPRAAAAQVGEDRRAEAAAAEEPPEEPS